MHVLVRLALRAFPPALNRRYGAELMLVFDARLQRVRQERGSFAAVRLTALTVADIVGQGLAERVRSMASRGPAVLASMPVFSLGLAIGVATTAFSLAYPVAWQPLAFPDGDRLFVLDESRPDGRPVYAGLRSARAWRQDLAGLAAVTVVDPWLELKVEASGHPELVRAAAVDADYFAVMGHAPILGRGFDAADVHPDGAAVVALRESLWRRRFAADPGIVGRRVSIHGISRLVVGVWPDAASDPQFSGWGELWIPRAAPVAELEETMARWLRVMARPHPGVSADALRMTVAATQQRLAEAHPATHARRGVVVRTLRHAQFAEVLPRLALMGAAVGLLLLLACLNVGVLAAATVRRRVSRRPAVKVAVGLRHFVRHLWVRGCPLMLATGTTGVLLAVVAVPALRAQLSPSLPPGIEPSVGGASLAFAVAVSMLAAVVTTAVVAAGARFAARPRDRAGAGAGRGVDIARRAVVIAQLTVSAALLAGTGLLLEAVLALARHDPGFTVDGLVAVPLALPADRYREPRARQQLFLSLARDLRAHPDVEAVGATDYLPLEGGWQKQVYLAGPTAPPPGAEPSAYSKPVTPGFFRAMGIPLLQGRDVTEGDVIDGAPVVVVDEAAARSYWPGGTAIGRQLRHAIDGPLLTVVGVVGTAGHTPAGAAVRPTVYHPYPARGDLQLVVRARAAGRGALIALVAGAVERVAPDVPLGRVRHGVDLVERTFSGWRADLALASLIASVALFLTASGAHGIAAAMAAECAPPGRSHGVRINRTVLATTMWTSVVGLSLGVPATLALFRVVGPRLVAGTASVPGTYAAVALLLLIIVIAASYVPARRAGSESPSSAFRVD